MPSQSEIKALLKFATKFAISLTKRPETGLLPLITENGQEKIFGDYCLYLLNGDLNIKRIGLDEVTNEAHYSIKYQSGASEIAIFNGADQQQTPSKIIDADTISDDLSDLEYRKIVALFDRACNSIKSSNHTVFDGLLNLLTKNCSDFIHSEVRASRNSSGLTGFLATLSEIEEEGLRQFSELRSQIDRRLSEINHQLEQTQRPSSAIDPIGRDNTQPATARTQAETRERSSSTPSYAASQTNAAAIDFLLSQEHREVAARQTTPPPPYSERDPFPRVQNPPTLRRNISTTNTTTFASAALSTNTTPSTNTTSVTTNSQPPRRMLPSIPSRSASRAGATTSTNTTPSAATSRRPEDNSISTRLNSANSEERRN